MKKKKILLHTPLIKWYLKHGMRLTAVHLVEHEPCKLFSLFPEEVANARCEVVKIP